MLKSDRIIALDIGASGLKLAEFATLKSGGIELTSYAIGSLGVDPQSEGDRTAFIGSTIRDLLQEANIKPGPVLLSVSGQSVFSRFVKLPPVDKDKVFQIILYEAQQNVPFPMDEVVWDYQLISGGAEGEMDVMLAAIKSDIVEHLMECVEASGLRPDLVDVAPMSLYNAVRYNYADLPPCTLVIDIGARSTDLIFIEAGRVFSRSVPVAGNTITQQIMQEFSLTFEDAEEMKKAHAFVAFGGAYEGPKSETVDKVSKSVRSIMTRLHAEINRSINFYRSQQAGQTPSLILLTGGTAIIPYTDTFLKEKLKVDVDYLNPFLNVAVSGDIPAEQIGKHAHMLGQVVGLALRRELSCPIELNLMPSKVMEEKKFRAKQPVILAAVACAVIILAVWCGYFIKMGGLAQKRLERIRADNAALEQVQGRLALAEQEVSDVSGKIDSVIALSGKRALWLDILDQIDQCIPEGIWLTVLNPVIPAPSEPPQDGMPATGDGTSGVVAGGVRTIELQGAGYLDKASSAGIIAFRDKLRAMPLFSEKTEIGWQPAPGPEDFIIEFKIDAVLKEPLAL